MEIELNEMNFEKEVVESPVPVLVDFWAPWCGPCMMLAPVLEQVVAERAGSVKLAKVNVDECPALAARFGITSIPAVYLFKDGAAVGSSVGYMDKDALVSRFFR